MKTQNFRVIPDGVIKSGHLTLITEPETGKITYKGQVVAKKFLFSKTIPFDGVYYLTEKELLRCDNKTPGQIIEMGLLTLIVADISNPKSANCKVTLKGSSPMNGNASIDMTKEFISIKRLRLAGNVYGFDVRLDVVEV